MIDTRRNELICVNLFSLGSAFRLIVSTESETVISDARAFDKIHEPPTFHYRQRLENYPKK